MKLVLPNMQHKEKAIEFINEFYEYKSEINGSGGLDRFLDKSTYEEWLHKIINDIDIANIEKPRVPALTYFYIREDDDKIIGMVNIRLALNYFLKTEGGHIGYCIRPTERKKHYATSMLNDSLKVCDCIGIKEVIVSCDKENIASAKTIINCNGRLESEFYSDTFNETIQRYLIQQ
ncbi:MAG TPA: GNAT family N-acetyltransferase [Lachnospiraceae bacterium]|nr:GNAT family N-acetyltransferase [Lachnospiraceae bacterium]